MSATNNITHQAQLAVQAYLVSKSFTNIANTSIYAGIQRTAEDVEAQEVGRTLPAIEVVCQSAESYDDADFEGNWWADVSVMVVHNASLNTAAQHHADAGAVFAELCQASSTMRNSFTNALSNFNCYDVMGYKQAWDIDERNWISTLEFRLACSSG